MEKYHQSVMPSEVIEFIGVKSGGVYADLTFGEGGHSRLLLNAGAVKVVAFDRDPEAVRFYQADAELKNDARFELLHASFSDFSKRVGDREFDGVLIDLGVSTRQLLRGERGFSFQESGPIDMRMNPDEGRSLLQELQNLREEEIADILYYNADIRESRRLARKICEARDSGELNSTLDLAKIAGPKRPYEKHPATAMFLALRMFINDELGEIDAVIPQVVDRLKVGGRLVVLTFHSTEDRLVKQRFQTLAGKCICREPICRCPRVEKVRIITKKPVEPTDEECSANPRARSAKLRCIEKLESPT